MQMLEAVFTKGVDEIEVPGLFQWDRGQVLSISIPGGLPSTYQVHFAYRGSSKALNVTVFDSDTVGIPDEVLTQPLDIVAYVYIITEDSGETVKTIHLPVTPRQRPEDYTELPPSFQERVDAMLVDINTKANNAFANSENALEVSEIAAENSTKAAQSAAEAAASAEAAKNFADLAQEITNLTPEQLYALTGDIDCGSFAEG